MTRRGFLALAMSARDESIARVAERELSAHEYVLLRTSDGTVLSQRWPAGTAPVPLGSLVKPFLALAYGDSHDWRYPELLCETCWLPQGHGRMDVTNALAQSCNSYFVQLVRRTQPEAIRRTVSQFGLSMPGEASPESLIGRYGTWRASPRHAALAYCELAHRRIDPGVPLILRAMKQCARSGTAAAIGPRAAAKTGTAPCQHATGVPGDGLLMALFPADTLGFVLLIRAHGVPGAECARRAAPFLRLVVP